MIHMRGSARPDEKEPDSVQTWGFTALMIRNWFADSELKIDQVKPVLSRKTRRKIDEPKYKGR